MIMTAGKLLCVTGIHQWKEEHVQLAPDVYREERHCTCCGKKQIHIRMFPRVGPLKVYRLTNYASYTQGDAVDTVTRHSLVPAL